MPECVIAAAEVGELSTMLSFRSDLVAAGNNQRTAFVRVLNVKLPGLFCHSSCHLYDRSQFALVSRATVRG